MKLRAFDVCFRAVERGYALDEIRPCFDKPIGNGYFNVDVSHAAYPAKLKNGHQAPKSLRASALAMVAELGVVSEPMRLPLAAGPGTELHALLRDWLGIEPSPTCPCRSMAKKMDARGPDWCEGEGMAEILGVMRDEHGKRWKARQTILPWTDTGARQLVLLACKRARNKAGDSTQNTG